MMEQSRTDRIRAEIIEELEAHRPSLDADTPLTSVTVILDLHPDGNVRHIKFRADRQRELGRRKVFGDQRRERR